MRIIARRTLRELRELLVPREPKARMWLAWFAEKANEGKTSIGKTPNATVVITDTMRVNASTRPSRMEYDCAPSGGGSIFAAKEVVQNAINEPARVATNESSRHSVSSCRVRRVRLAPSAERMDSSAARSVVRAIRRFATFVHAISRTSTTAPMNISEAFLTGPASPSCSEVRLGRKEFPTPASFVRRSASMANAARARGHETPGFSRATVPQPLLPGLKAAGFQRTAWPG